ncbi:MAG: type II secretion system protein [Patescibacteria group bacterium]|jgi:prepilin-type N-terminal cleavage/methylation domain-containing protein
MNQQVLMRRKSGFTLIELLVVISIIGLLSTLAVVSLNNARAKARDARRLSDLKAVQSALEIYRDDNTDYVINLGPSWGDTINAINNGTNIYLPAGAPTDPDPTRDVAQPNVNKSYIYCVTADLSFYLLHASLEVSPPGQGIAGDITYPPGSCVNAAGPVDPLTFTCDGDKEFCLGRL